MEFITANGVEYAAKLVTTTASQVIMTFEDRSIADMETTFRQATDLTVSGEDRAVYGTYTGLAFDRATVLASGDVVVTMRVKTETEQRLDALEDAQRVQDGAISDLGAAVSDLADGGVA